MSLRRSDSLTSLSKVDAAGFIHLDVKWTDVPDSQLTGVVKSGHAMNLACPYIKIYLSKSGKDIKHTKFKTTAKKDAEFNENFSFSPLEPNLISRADARLQVTCWDAASKRSKAVGGFSISLTDIFIARSVKGWFKFLPETEGRGVNIFAGTENEPAMMADEAWHPVKRDSAAVPVNEDDATTSTSRIDQVEPHFEKKETSSKPGVIVCNEDAVAKFAYTSDSKGELSFEAGDVIKVTEKRSTGWWLGKLAGRTGWFPASFVYSGNLVVVVQGRGPVEHSLPKNLENAEISAKNIAPVQPSVDTKANQDRIEKATELYKHEEEDDDDLPELSGDALKSPRVSPKKAVIPDIKTESDNTQPVQENSSEQEVHPSTAKSEDIVVGAGVKSELASSDVEMDDLPPRYDNLSPRPEASNVDDQSATEQTVVLDTQSQVVDRAEAHASTNSDESIDGQPSPIKIEIKANVSGDSSVVPKEIDTVLDSSEPVDPAEPAEKLERVQRRLDDTKDQLELFRGVVLELQERELGLNEELADAKAAVVLRDVDIEQVKHKLEQCKHELESTRYSAANAERLSRQSSALEITQLKVKLEGAVAVETRLRRENQSLESTVTELKSRLIDTAQKQQEVLAGVSDAKNGLMEQLEEELKTERIRVAQLENEVGELKDAADRADRISAAEADARNSMESQMSELNEKIAEMLKDSSEASESRRIIDRDLAEATARLDQAIANNKVLESRVSEWEHRFDDQQTRSMDSVAVAEELKTKVKQLELELENADLSADRRVAASEREVERLTIHCKELEGKINNVATELETELRDKVLLQERSRSNESDIESMASKLDREIRARRACEDRENALRASIAAQREEMEVVVRTAKEAERELDTLREVQRKMDKLQAENRHFHAIMNLKDDLDYREQVLELESKMKQIQKEKVEFEAMQDDKLVGKLLAQISQLDQENQGLRETVQKLVEDLMVAKNAT